MTHTPLSRRQLLATIGTASGAGLAGCTGTVFDSDAESEACPPYEPVESSTTAWHGQRGPPTNTGLVAASAVPDGTLTLDWEASIPTHVGHHVPIIADGTVYASDLHSQMSALDAATGETLWRTDITDPRGAPAVNGDTLVVRTRDDIRALETDTGDVRWSETTFGTSLFDASPIIANDTVYLQAGIATYALALADGARRWRVPTGLPSTATPAVSDDTVYVAGDDTYVRALSPTDGRERWRTKTTARIECNLSLVGETLLAGTEAGNVHAFDAATGTERWRQELPPAVSGDSDRPERPEILATDGSRVYVGTDTQLVALAIATGTRCWRDRTYAGGYASGVAVGDGHVYAPTTRTGAYISVFDAASGNRVQRLSDEQFEHFTIGPSLAEEGLYIAGGNAVARLD